MIYFFQLEPLVDDLVHDRVSSKTVFIYFCISFVIFGKFSFLLQLLSDYSLDQIFAHFVSGLIITLFGLTLCFRVNQKGDGRSFLARFFCLSVPILVRLFLLSLGILFIEGIFLIFFDRYTSIYIIPEWIETFNFLLGVVLDLWYFLWISAKLSFIAKAKS